LPTKELQHHFNNKISPTIKSLRCSWLSTQRELDFNHSDSRKRSWLTLNYSIRSDSLLVIALVLILGSGLFVFLWSLPWNLKIKVNQSTLRLHFAYFCLSLKFSDNRVGINILGSSQRSEPRMKTSY